LEADDAGFEGGAGWDASGLLLKSERYSTAACISLGWLTNEFDVWL
jgi:hypothetical protein